MGMEPEGTPYWFSEYPVTVLYRPVGPDELDLIRKAAWNRFPPRLPEHPSSYLSFGVLESDVNQSFTFFRSSVSTYRLIEKFCKENPAFTRNLAKVKSSFNPIAAFYQDSMQAWIYANSQAAETRDALGPEAWDRYQEMRKYIDTNILPSVLSPEENFKKWLGRKK
jgi:hypothetical protein